VILQATAYLKLIVNTRGASEYFFMLPLFGGLQLCGGWLGVPLMYLKSTLDGWGVGTTHKSTYWVADNNITTTTSNWVVANCIWSAQGHWSLRTQIRLTKFHLAQLCVIPHLLALAVMLTPLSFAGTTH